MDMFLKEANDEELKFVYELGYKEWSKGKSFDEYVKDHQKGTHYVLIDDIGEIYGSLNVEQYDESIFGLGNIVIKRGKRGLGLGKLIVQLAIEEVKKVNNDPSILLHSEIHPDFYKKFGFEILPEKFQTHKGIVSMLYSNKLAKITNG
jgi:predicted GNAT family N-acyltransferase